MVLNSAEQVNFREWPCAGIRLRYNLCSMHQAVLRSEVVFQSLQFFDRSVARVAST